MVRNLLIILVTLLVAHMLSSCEVQASMHQLNIHGKIDRESSWGALKKSYLALKNNATAEDQALDVLGIVNLLTVQYSLSEIDREKDFVAEVEHDLYFQMEHDSTHAEQYAKLLGDLKKKQGLLQEQKQNRYGVNRSILTSSVRDETTFRTLAALSHEVYEDDVHAENGKSKFYYLQNFLMFTFLIGCLGVVFSGIKVS